MRSVIAAVLAIGLAGCRASGDRIELGERFASGDGVSIDVHVVVRAEHRRDAPRYLRAAAAFLATVSRWVPLPQTSLTIVDLPQRRDAWTDRSAVLLDARPWWSTPTAMRPELATARALGRRYWLDLVDTRALPAWFVNGLVEYTARRAVAATFQGENNPPGYAMLEARAFGGFVPWFIRVRVLPEMVSEPFTKRADATARCLLVLNTLERWLSRPVLDGALAEFIRSGRDGPVSIEDFERVVSATSGQDLSWLFAQAFDPAVTFDYAIKDLTSSRNADGTYDTTVTVARLGDGLFTGTSRPRVGPFENGRGITLQVSFENGAEIEDHWDGRERHKTFVYRGAARARSATVDPARVVVLDVHQMNNSQTLSPRSGSAARRWSAQWSLWLENVLLTYAAFV
jgi:hypothetical protein